MTDDPVYDLMNEVRALLHYCDDDDATLEELASDLHKFRMEYEKKSEKKYLKVERLQQRIHGLEQSNRNLAHSIKDLLAKREA